MQLWQSPIPWLQTVFRWFSDYLSEVWLFAMAVFLLWRPAFPERLQNGLAVAGLMSVASALIRLKKIEHKIDEMRATQLLREGRDQAKWVRRLKKLENEHDHEQVGNQETE